MTISIVTDVDVDNVKKSLIVTKRDVQRNYGPPRGLAIPLSGCISQVVDEMDDKSQLFDRIRKLEFEVKHLKEIFESHLDKRLRNGN